MIKRNLPTLKIHKLKYNQYNEIKDANAISDNEIYEITDAAVITDNEKAGYDSHIADADIHVTADEKAAWNEKEIFTINVSGTAGSLSSDKNIEDIIEAYNSGKKCIAIYNGAQYNLTNNPENDGIVPYARFMAVLNNTLSSITVGKIGLSAEFGWEDGSNITYNTLPSVSSTDSGKVLIVNDSGNWEAAVIKPTITATTLLASNWDSTAKTYSFESTYPSANYDIEVDIDGDRCTDEQLNAWIAAKPLSSSTNKIVAKGDIPTVDIPVILTITPK